MDTIQTLEILALHYIFESLVCAFSVVRQFRRSKKNREQEICDCFSRTDDMKPRIRNVSLFGNSVLQAAAKFGPVWLCSAYSSSSKRWVARQRRDSFSREAKVQQFKSRAAFKLLEVTESSWLHLTVAE